MKRGKRSKIEREGFGNRRFLSSKSSKTAAKTIMLLTLLTLLSFFFLSLAKAPTWVLTETQAEFNEGTYTNVSFNSSGVIKFIQGELPNSQADEEGANMTGSVLLMHMNEAAGASGQTIEDTSGTGNNGTFTHTGSGNMTSDGKFNNASYFDGSGDYIDAGKNSSLMPTNAITLSAWFKVPSSGQTFIIISQDIVSSTKKGYNLFTYNNIIYIDIGDGGSYHRISTSEPSIGVWHQVAVTYNGSIQKMYIDGETAGTPSSWTGTISYNDYVVYIGKDSLGQSSAGTIDEVAIYNRSLSADEILQHYLRTNATHGTYESKVYDANRTVSWENMSWTQGVPYQEELPHDQTDEKDAGIVGGANMSGNVLLMHFNNDSAYGENNTRAYDFSGNGNNGTAVDNAAPTSAGKFNGAFTFDGSGDYIDCGNDSSLDITGEITISVWVFAKDTSINPILEKSNAYSTGEGYNIYYYNNGNTYVNIESGQHLLGCAGLIHTNTWDHLAFTFNGSHAVLYQNGIEKCSSDVAYNLDPSTDPLTIGTYARTVPNDYFNGLIDEVAIWNRTLSAAEILEHYKRSALNLTFQVRSDGDNASWPDYIGPDNTSSSYFTNASLANLSLTNLSNARYFQYKAYFDTNNTAYTPELWNVTGGYEDEIAPTISISSPSNTTYTTASIDLNWTYDETPDWCAYSLNGGANVTGCTNTTITAQQGGNNLTIWANDSSGNMGQSSYVYFTVDSIYPTVDLDLPDNTTYTTNESLALNYSVYDLNNDSCWYNIDSGSNTSLASCANTTFNVSGPGGYTLTLYANDTFGNENSSSVVFTVDLNPTSTLISPENASWSDSTTTFTCNGSDSTALSAITLYIWNSTGTYSTNATSASGVSAQASWNYTLPENNYTWNCLVNDTQNNEDWDTNRTLYVDTTNPQINFTSPTEASGDYVKTNYTYVNVTVSDANNVSSFINWNYSLVGYWNFNNVVGGVVYDNSTYGNNGTMSGFTSNTTTTGKFGSALEFDGTDDHVDVGDPADGSLDFGTGDFTISAWIKKDQTGRYDVFLSKDKYAQGGDSSWRGYAFEFSTSTNNLYFLTGQGTANTLVSSQTAFEANKWYYIVGVRRSGYLYIYVNGEDDQPTPVASTHNVDNDWDFMIGRHPDATYPRHFDGKIDEVRIWNRALSAEEINASYNTGLYSLYHNFTGLADGNYSYYAQTIDLAGNMNQTETRNLIIDTTAPNVSLISPANETYTSDTSPNLTANITDNLGIKNATLHVYNETDSINETTTSFSEGTVERLLGIVYNFLYDGVFKWFYSAYDWAGNLFSAGNYTLTIDTTNPLISVTFPANNSNLSQTWINITGTASDTNNDTVYVNDTRFGDNTGTYASWNFTNTTIADGTYSINITANDSASKTNSTIIIFTIDATAPNITNMSISPSAAADIDPNVNINVTVNVTDVTTSVDTIVLRYWNYSTNVSTSSNVTMSSAGGDLFNASFNASVNGTWYYQVWANDSAGNNINNTPNSTDVQYECTWEISDTISDPTLGAFETTEVIGNITINNTGDAGYPTHSCTLSFILTDNLATGRISYSPSDAVISLAAKDTSTVNITATFLNKVVSEGLVITITDYGRKSATYQTTSNATLTSYAGGPYFNVVINSSPSAVNQTAALNFTLSVYVQNIGNESASNVTLNWTLPTGWGNASGILSVNVSTLNCSDPTISPSIGCDTNASLNTLVNLITATVSDPNTASIGTVTMLANSSSESKVNSSCTANCSYVSGSDSATATVSCYAVSDGVCPTSGTCSYDSTANNYDPDCTAPAAETITTGGGGGAGAAPAAIVAEAIYELVRGKDEDFSLEVKNPFKDASLRDIKMKVTGFLAPYITIEPAVLDKIEPNSTFNFTIRITAPAYFTVGKHDLTFTISSTKQVGVTETARTEKRYVTLAIHDVGRGDAAQLVSDSEDAIAEMMQLGLNVKKVQQLLSELQDEFEKSKYENVKELSQKVSTIKQNALSSQDTIESLQEKIKDAEGKGIKAEDTKILLNLAIAAFERGDYALALERAKDAEMTYAVETKGEFNLLYFVANNTIECLVGIIILTFLSALLFLKVKLSITNHSITSLYSEQDILLGLMKTVQHECFIEKKMSMGEYRQSMLEYEDRFSKAVQHALKLESIKANLFKLKKKGLEMERQGILKLMKELQSKYIKEGKVETRVYDQKMQSFTARLSEIEEQIALNEAKRALHRAKHKRFLRRFGLARPKATERLARKKKQTEHKRMKLKEKIKRRFESVIKKATEKKEKELDRKRKEQIERAKEEAPKQRKKEKLREKIRKRFERVVEREEKKRAKSRKK